MAAVYGPKAAAMRKEDPERAVVEIIWRAKNGLPGISIHNFSVYEQESRDLNSYRFYNIS